MSVINTNIGATYSQNAMKTNSRAMNTVMEQLSTGTRVNSAKDDAAGLAIGQNMTSQIRGLNQAVRNLNDGINMMQTAEGSMIEQSNMLQRMRELAVQSMNGTYSEIQRGYMDQEFQALSTQINKVALDTQWNDQKLISAQTPAVAGNPLAASATFTPAAATALGGTLAAGTITAAGRPVGAVTLTTQVSNTGVSGPTDSSDAPTITVGALTAGNTYNIVVGGTARAAGNVEFVATGVPADDAALLATKLTSLGAGSVVGESTATASGATVAVSAGTVSFQITAVRTAAEVAAGLTSANASIAIDDATASATAAKFTGVGTVGKQAAGGTAYNGQQIAVAINAALSAAGSTATVSANATTGVITTVGAALSIGLGGTAANAVTAASNRTAAAAALGLSVDQLGTQAVGGRFTYQSGMSAAQTVDVVIGDMTTAGLFAGNNVNISSLSKATSSLTVVSEALEKINNQRATIGAAINQMTYATDNLANISSNATQSRSSIIDTDYAKATTELSKTQIIQQAATAMLAQANQQPQAVMALLKG